MIGLVLALIGGAAVLLPSMILAVLAVVSLRRDTRRSSRPRTRRPILSVLVAAHDEERIIGATLAAIAAVDPAIRVHVMADNCSDRTAEVAALASACVHERHERLLPGKPAALNRLIAEVLEEDPRAHAFAFLDADARPESGFFDALRGPIARGAQAVQAKNLVAVSDAPLSRLRAIAFHLKCDLRPRAYDALRLSVGLHGNGMCLTRDVLRRYAWKERSVVEDGELHLRLARDGIRVELAPSAIVRSPMPTSFGEASGQAVRWERGKVDLFDDATRLLRTGIRARRPIAIAAAIDTLIPPLSFLIAAGGAFTVTALVMRSAPLFAVGVASLLAIAVYVARGVTLARLDARALVSAAAWAGPYVLWKVLVLARTLLGAGRGQWSQARTQVREVIS